MDGRELVWEDMDWIHLSQDRDQWLALVNTVINHWVHKRGGISRVTESLLASQEGFCHVYSVS